MGRASKVGTRTRLHVWILSNQDVDLKAIGKRLKKSKTDMVIEALGMYINSLRRQGLE